MVIGKKGQIRDVAAGIRLRFKSGRDILRGISRYACRNCHWRLHIINVFDQNTVSEFKAAMERKVDGILLNGTRFHDCSTFEHDGSTCLLFPFKDDVELDVGKLAMWRLQTHGNFGGTWLSDYVPNQLGGFISKEQTAETVQKPDCPLIGQDGNIFNLMGIASRTLKQNGLADQAKEMCDRIRESGDYYKALGVIGEYVNITSVDDAPDEGEDFEEGMEMQL